MPEELHQKISQFLDNELEIDEALELLHTMQHKEDLHHKMQRYQAISHALKSQVFLPVKTDFSARIAQAIHEYEEHHPTLLTKTFKPFWLTLAASATFLAVIGFQINDLRLNKPHPLPAQTTQQTLATLSKTNNHNRPLLLHSNDVLAKIDTKTVSYQHK
ncbi:MAG: sigma-E factor negative regulatory protein [Methylococcaceae bacterium]